MRRPLFHIAVLLLCATAGVFGQSTPAKKDTMTMSQKMERLDVMYLILIAVTIIIPVSYYIIMEWMNNFAYQTELNYLTFGVVAVFASAFAFLTVAFHPRRRCGQIP